MVDEEGFSPIEMARVLSERVRGDYTPAGFAGERLMAGNDISIEPVAEASKHHPTSILKRPHSSCTGVKFDIKSISDDEEDDPFQNHSASAQDNVGVATPMSRLTRPSTSNFLEVQSDLINGYDSLMEVELQPLNFDTQTSDDIMRKM
jgi:hypothetical protein